MSPKSLLRHARAVSSLVAISPTGRSATVLDDARASDPRPRRARAHVLGQGLLRARRRRARSAAPGRHRHRARRAALSVSRARADRDPRPGIPGAGEFAGCRRSRPTRARGTSSQPRLERVLAAARRRLTYVGREEAASPATGIPQGAHQAEEKAIVEAALGGPAGAGKAHEPTCGSRPSANRSLEGVDRPLAQARRATSCRPTSRCSSSRRTRRRWRSPRPAAGRLEIVEPEGATVEVGAVVGRIAEQAAGAPARRRTRVSAPQRAAASRPPTAQAAPQRRRRAELPAGASPARRPRRRRRPRAELVAERGVDPRRSPAPARDGGHEGGRCDRATCAGARRPCRPPRRLRAAAAPRRRPPRHGAAAAAAPVAARARRDGRPAGATLERVPMSHLRRRIAERLVEAQHTAAILTTFNEVDMSARDGRCAARYRERFKSAHGVDLGFMSLFGRAAIAGAADVPVVNARIDGNDIVYHRRRPPRHRGEHRARPRRARRPQRRRHALRRARARHRPSWPTRAREARLVPDELARRHVHHHQRRRVRLAALHADPQPAAGRHPRHAHDRGAAGGGATARSSIRPMMYVALTYDHRLVDGRAGRDVPGARQGAARGSRPHGARGLTWPSARATTWS